MADLRAALGHALEPAYRVEREVRPVGNCRMFVALEKSAGGGLLVKVLPGALSLAVDSTRFEQEIARLGRRLRHPSLVAPRNAGRVGSFVYHTRTFVEGTTLRAWLARHGELPLRRAVEVLRDVLTALAHAHADGLAHGDLKPENVLLADGQALVAERGRLIQCGMRNEECGIDGGGPARGASAGTVLPSRRGPARARSHSGRELDLRASDDDVGTGRVEDPHVGPVRRATPARPFRTPHSAFRIPVDV